jgi:hypothetical protein
MKAKYIFKMIEQLKKSMVLILKMLKLLKM